MAALRADAQNAGHSVALALVLAIFAVGCGKAAPVAGQKVACTCTFLTDFDDPARVDVDLCLADGKPLEAEAKACAARTAHNHVEKCECKPPTGPCDAAAKDACDAH